MSPVFFTDRDLGKRFPQLLVQAGLRVERHADHLMHDVRDEEWLSLVGANGWIAITHDQRIRYKLNELTAVRRNNVALLVVVGKVPHAELAANFIRTLPKIQEFLASNSPPLIARITRPSPSDLSRNPTAPGNIRLIYR